MARELKKHLMVSTIGVSGLQSLCGQYIKPRKKDPYGHLSYYFENVTCKNCLSVLNSIRNGKEPKFGLTREHILNRKHCG